MKDVFHQKPKMLSNETKEQITSIKDVATELWEYFDSLKNKSSTREMALAKTNLEQCVMWAVKSITGDIIENNEP